MESFEQMPLLDGGMGYPVELQGSWSVRAVVNGGFEGHFSAVRGRDGRLYRARAGRLEVVPEE